MVPVISRGCSRAWGVRRVVLLCAMCWLMPVPHVTMKGMAKVRAVVIMHTHGPNYQCARYEYGPSPPQDTLLVSLVPGISRAIVRGCTTCWVDVRDVLTDTGSA